VDVSVEPVLDSLVFQVVRVLSEAGEEERNAERKDVALLLIHSLHGDHLRLLQLHELRSQVAHVSLLPLRPELDVRFMMVVVTLQEFAVSEIS